MTRPSKQRYEELKEQLTDRFVTFKREHPEQLSKPLNLSWSNWGFGLEEFEVSVARLAANDVPFIELHGNHYGPSLGYQPAAVNDLLSQYGMKVSGTCGMFSDDNDLSSNRPTAAQAALDYIQRELAFTAAVGGHYLLVVPASCGRPEPLDDYEFIRSARLLRQLGDEFAKYQIKAAIEPIRSAEVSIVHTVADAEAYLAEVGHPAIAHINGDVYHMQSEEQNIAQAILRADQRLVNLHLADSNRCALGDGSMDLDAIIMACYLIGMNQPGRFVTPEPLGPGAGPYPARNGITPPEKLDVLVHDSVSYFREREAAVLAL